MSAQYTGLGQTAFGGECTSCGKDEDEHHGPDQYCEAEDYDPTPWCHYCGAMRRAQCNCGPIAEND